MQPDPFNASDDFSRRSLCLFMNETGYENFKSERVFAIGGVAGFRPQVEHASRLWQEMKAKQGQDGASPERSTGTRTTITDLFARSHLPRFAFIVKRPPIFPSSVNVLRLLHPLMVEELARMIGELPTLPSNVVICLEHTELFSPKIIQAMPAISLEINETEVPVTGVFTHGESPEPLLEMAGHLTWQARQCKAQLPTKGLSREFVAMFPEGARYAICRELRLEKTSGGQEPHCQLSFVDNTSDLARLNWRTRRAASA
jgi:hypothetical protein